LFSYVNRGDNKIIEFLHTNELIFFTKEVYLSKQLIACNFFDYFNAANSNIENLNKVKSGLFEAPILETSVKIY